MNKKDWKKYRVVPRAHPSGTLLYVYFSRSGSKGAFRFPGATWDHFHCRVEPSPGHIQCPASSGKPNQRKVGFASFWGGNPELGSHNPFLRAFYCLYQQIGFQTPLLDSFPESSHLLWTGLPELLWNHRKRGTFTRDILIQCPTCLKLEKGRLHRVTYSGMLAAAPTILTDRSSCGRVGCLEAPENSTPDHTMSQHHRWEGRLY